MRLDRRLPLGSHTDSKTKGETVCKDSFVATAEFLYTTGTARQPHTTRERAGRYRAGCDRQRRRLPASIPLSVETHTLRPLENRDSWFMKVDEPGLFHAGGTQ